MKVKAFWGLPVIGLIMLLAGCRTTAVTQSTTFNQMNPGKITEKQAIEIASAYVLQDALASAKVTTSV